MKKFMIALLILIILTIIYYFKADYNITYKIKNYNIKEIHKEDRYYFEINNKQRYNLDIYSKRKMKKMNINKIKEIKNREYTCIIPKSDTLKLYPLCTKNGKNIVYHEVKDSKIITDLKKEGYQINPLNKDNTKVFQDYKNINKNEYIAIWKYDGFYLINKDGMNTKKIFKRESYDSTQIYRYDQYLITADYDSEHLFNKFIIVNIIDGKVDKLDAKEDIDFDGYFMGSCANDVYYFDNKFDNQYKINIKKKTIDIIGNNELGYFECKSNKLIKTKHSRLSKDKVTFTKERYHKYINNKFLSRKIIENNNIQTTIVHKKVDYIDNYKDSVYFLDKDILFKYNNTAGHKKMIRNFEWNFNKQNKIFIYNK